MLDKRHANRVNKMQNLPCSAANIRKRILPWNLSQARTSGTCGHVPGQQQRKMRHGVLTRMAEISAVEMGAACLFASRCVTRISYVQGLSAVSFQKVTRASAAGGLKSFFQGNTMTWDPSKKVTKVDPRHCHVRNVPGWEI